MEQAIQLDNEAIAQNNTAYWENLTDQVKLRDGFIRDQEYLMAYALYQFNYRETPIYATGQALIQQEITEEQLYSQLNAWTLADQLVYPALDFVGLIPGVDIGADLVGFFYAQLRGDMQQIPLYAMALMIPPGFDNVAHYGGRGTSRMVAVYTENGITYVPKLANEPIDEAVEAVRASVLTHDPVIAQAIIDADAPYVFHEADELYKKRYSAIYPGTGNDLAKAKLITGEIADHCPLLLANPQLVTRELSEVLAGMPDATKRKAFLEALDGFGDIGKLTTFVDDLANAPELVVALKGRWELVRAWEVLHPHANRTNISILNKRVEFDELPLQWRKENPFNNQDLFDPNTGGYTVSHTGHNDYPHEYDMANAIAGDGRVVKLRDESTPDPAYGNKTPDADIDGVVHDFKNFDSPNNVNGKVYNHIISGGSRSNAPGVTFNLQGNSASLADVNQGLDDVRLLISNNGVPSGMADQVGLVYSDGSVIFLTKDEIINGAYF